MYGYAFIAVFRCRIHDAFKQDWYGTLEKSTVLYMYRNFKTSLEYESYLDILPKSLRFFFCRLRLSVHPLHIQTGRYARNNVVRNQRYCQCCNSNDIEDEFNFVCVCSSFTDIKKKYIKKCYYIRPSVFKYLQLLQSRNVCLLKILLKQGRF